MKEYDRVELIVDREEYKKEGVNKGRSGWICDPQKIDGEWLVSFDQLYDLPNIATIPVKKYDLVVMSKEFNLEKGERVLFLNQNYKDEGLELGMDGIVVEYNKKEKTCLVNFNVKRDVPTPVSVNEDCLIKFSVLNKTEKERFGHFD